MPAEKGNKYAEKWTEEETMKVLTKIEKEAKKPTCLWLGSALVKFDLYKDIWQYWKNKFPEDSEVFRTIKKVELIFEDRIVTNGLSGKANPTITIFALKNNYDWKDKTEQDVNVKANVAYSDMTEEQLQNEYRRLAEKEGSD